MATVPTHAGGKLFIATTPQNVELDESGFAALTFSTEISKVISATDLGATTNFVDQPYWDTTFSEKGEGTTSGNNVTITLGKDLTDAGQQALIAAANDRGGNYAFKRVLANGDVVYFRGIVGQPNRPGGENEDFDQIVFQVGLNQPPIDVAPIAS